jgi:hypothetical protein
MVNPAMAGEGEEKFMIMLEVLGIGSQRRRRRFCRRNLWVRKTKTKCVSCD